MRRPPRKALLDNTDTGAAEQIVKKALEIAGELCIYTNHAPHDRNPVTPIE